MKKFIIIALCAVLAVSGVAAAVVLSANGDKTSSLLEDGCWMSDATYMLDDVEDYGVGFVFKPFDKESGIAVSLDREEFPYVVRDGVVMMFRYNSDDECYDHMFNGRIEKLEGQDMVGYHLILTPTKAGCDYINEWPPEETNEVYLRHIERNSDTDFTIKCYFDYWSTAQNGKTRYTNGFSSEGFTANGAKYKDFRQELYSLDRNIVIYEFFNHSVEFDDSYGNMKGFYYDTYDEKWYYTPGVLSHYDESDAMNISFAHTGVLSSTGCEGEYEYDASLDALVKSDSSNAAFYRVTSFSDNDIVQPLSAEQQMMLDEAITKAELSTTDWQAAYKGYLEQRLEYDNPDYASFSLGYIDDDDIPELLYASDSSHASTVKVFTLYNGVLRSLGEFGSSGTVSYIERNGLICSSGMWQGNSVYAAYSIFGGRVDCIWQGEDNLGSAYDESVKIFYSNGEVVSESEYMNMVNKYFDENKLMVHHENSYSLTRDNIANTIQ
ncbi:MAG: hypothetical protein IJA87_10300 [Clostridia bacterium]|nr:hypothetical protein [Clostridia bacterium]